MFTGLVQKVGVFKAMTRASGGASIQVECAPWAGEPLVMGESVAVQGACLTVSAIRESGFSADVLDETLACTNLGTLKPGDPLNLERALRMSDRLGGHVVSGHIDATARIENIGRAGRDFRLRISCRPDEARYIVRKGSVALDGVSLTVSAVPGELEFEVCIIPTTWRETSLSSRSAGDLLNIETDIIARYVERLARGSAGGRGLTLEKLVGAGFGG